MKYIVKNRKTGEETLCEKVEVGGHDYYVAGDDFHNKNLQNNDLAYHWKTKELVVVLEYREQTGDWLCLDGSIRDSYKLKKVIATNNKSLDLPQVVDEVEELVDKLETPIGLDMWTYDEGFRIGYQKAKETYQFTVHDLMSFNEWFLQNEKLSSSYNDLIDLWQEQRTKTIIVE